MKLTRLAFLVPVALAWSCASHPAPAGASPSADSNNTVSTTAAPPAPQSGKQTAAAKVAADPRAAELARIVNLSKSSSRVDAYIEHICKVIGPRLTGSTQCNKAVEWAKQQFESFGLKATIEPWGEFAVGFDRGTLSGKILSPVSKSIDVGTSSWAVGTNGPTRGIARTMPGSVDDVKKDPAKYKNAWILRSGGRGTPAPGADMTSALREAGAHGYLRNTNSDLIHTGGNHRIEWDKWSKTLNINLKATEFKEIQDLTTSGKDVTLEFNIENKFVKGPVTVSNVYADLVGTELPDEYIIVGGHIDSWDGAEGATDNGTGVATTLEAARLLTQSGFKPKRTIRFMLWSGEEQGLLGSSAWIAKHPEMLPKISCVLVHDEGTNYLNGLNVTPSVRPLLEPVLKPLFTLNEKLPFELHDVKTLPMGIGSDHDAFLAAGVPGFFWIQQKGDVDYDRQHHTQYDRLDVVRSDYQKHSSIVVAYSALQAANLDRAIPRDSVGVRANRKRLGFQPGENMKVEVVTEDGAAAKAGMKPGDQILKLNGVAVADMTAFREEFKKVDKSAKITVLRDGKEIELTATWP